MDGWMDEWMDGWWIDGRMDAMERTSNEWT